MAKIIMFKGGVETLTYFSQELAEYFRAKGHDIFWYDLEQSMHSAKMVKKFIKYQETIVLTFNFLGLSGEKGCYDEAAGYIWEQYDIPCYNIVVDHPLYYAERYEQLPPKYYQIAIDRKHLQYMKDYYSDITTELFLPLAGNRIVLEPLSFEERFGEMEEWEKKRSTTIMFAGNYRTPEEYEPYITRINDEYTAFYRGIISELLHHPERSLEEVAKRHCVREMGQLSIEEWRICFQHMNFIDLYLRFTVRKRAIEAMLKAGFTVDVYGHGYEEFQYDGYDENARKRLRIHGPLNTIGCLNAMEQSKISLNVMPWFKDGAHDRIFSSMLQGSVSVTDDSIYLREQLTDGAEVIFYDLNRMDKMTERVANLLGRPDKMYNMAKTAYEYALNNHTWQNRAKVIEQYIKDTGFAL